MNESSFKLFTHVIEDENDEGNEEDFNAWDNDNSDGKDELILIYDYVGDFQDD